MLILRLSSESSNDLKFLINIKKMDGVSFGRRVIELFGKQKQPEDISERIMELNAKKVEDKKGNVDYSKF